jgi:hypothetical protein
LQSEQVATSCLLGLSVVAFCCCCSLCVINVSIL